MLILRVCTYASGASGEMRALLVSSQALAHVRNHKLVHLHPSLGIGLAKLVSKERLHGVHDCLAYGSEMR